MYEGEGPTILKCTGGPPNEVKPKYHVSLTVFQSRGPGFQADTVSRAQVLGDQPGLTPMVDFRSSAPDQIYAGLVLVLGKSSKL
jgi:hypothetical protein